MSTTKTLLVYCGKTRVWTNREIAKLVSLCKGVDSNNRYNLLLLETPNYTELDYRDWEKDSLNFLERIEKVCDYENFPDFYVASWGDESKYWIENIGNYYDKDFRGLYWNGGREDPFCSPPPEGLYDWAYTLWIPYTAGTLGIQKVAEHLNDCWFPNSRIAMQPNVYQTVHGRWFWDMLTAVRMARKYGLKLEIEFDERMFSDFYWYRFWNRIHPDYFTCVYGGAKEILNVERHLYG